jgi:hypothetical protein
LHDRKKDQKEKGRCKDVHPDWIYITGPPAYHILSRKKPRFFKKVFYGAEEPAVEMGDVFKKMRYQVPHRFLWLNVFLAAAVAIPAFYMNMAVETVLLLSFFKPAHLR